MNDPLYIAVDLGAGSGRIFISGLSQTELLLEEVHRFQYAPIDHNGHLRWNAERIFTDIKAGLRRASEWARQLGRPISSIGVDSWGTDYGLIDSEGMLCENPVCYRDKRTQDSIEKVFERISRRDISPHRHSIPRLQYLVPIARACTGRPLGKGRSPAPHSGSDAFSADGKSGH